MPQPERERSSRLVGNDLENSGHYHPGQSRPEAIQNLLREALFKRVVDPIKEILKPHIFGTRCLGDGCSPMLSIRMAV